MVIFRCVVCLWIALRTDSATDEDGRETGGAIRSNLQLLRSLNSPVPRAGKYWYDRRSDARDGYSAAIFELRRLVAGGVYDTCLYRHSTGCITTKWIDARQITDYLLLIEGK